MEKSDPMQYRPVADPDLQIGEGGGGPEARNRNKGGPGLNIRRGRGGLGSSPGSATAVRSVD